MFAMTFYITHKNCEQSKSFQQANGKKQISMIKKNKMLILATPVMNLKMKQKN